MTFQRTTKAYGDEESLHIYAGTTATGEPVYSETIGLQADTVYPPTNHCLTPGAYMAQMGDSFGDGWTNGSNLSIKVDDIEIEMREIHSENASSSMDVGPSWIITSTKSEYFPLERTPVDVTLPVPEIVRTFWITE